MHLTKTLKSTIQTSQTKKEKIFIFIFWVHPFRLYHKLEYENLSSNFYESLLYSETKYTISKFFKKKLYQYYHKDHFNCLHCYLVKGRHIEMLVFESGNENVHSSNNVVCQDCLTTYSSEKIQQDFLLTTLVKSSKCTTM